MIYLKSSTTAYSVDAHRSQTQGERGTVYNYAFKDFGDSVRAGLSLQEISFTPHSLTLNAVPWKDIISISFDNSTWQEVLFMDFSLNTIPGGGVYPFTVNMLISPLRLGTNHTYDNQWGLELEAVSQDGNHTSPVKLTYYAPRFYFPFTQSLVDFAGSSVNLTNPNTKSYGGVTYAKNEPIFDSGLYLSNEFSDSAKLTFHDSALQTIITQIKSTRYPNNWVIGTGAAPNLLTANQSDAETDTSGVEGYHGTLSRTTAAGEFYAGVAGFKLVCTAAGDIYLYTSGARTTGLTAGKYYNFSVYAKASRTDKNWIVQIYWYNAAHEQLSYVSTTSVAASTSFTRLNIIGKAPADTVECAIMVGLQSVAVDDILYADNLMLEELNETLTIWDDGSKNKLYIDIPNDLLKWTDYTSTISCTFPTVQFLTENSANTRKIVTIVAVHNGDTKDLHCKYEGGAFNNGTGALAALVWTNEMTLGLFDGILFNLIQYNYVLTAANYADLNFTLEPLNWNSFYIENITAGTIIFEDLNLTEENDIDITGLTSGEIIELTSGNVEMKGGLSAKWTIELRDCYVL